jgi:O-antigen ligase
MKLQHFALLITIYFIILQAISVYIGYRINANSILNFSLFQFGIILSFAFLIFFIKKYFKESKLNKLNYYVIALIFLYIGYQSIIIASIHYFQNDMPIREVFRFVINRSYFVVIPLLYWYVFPFFNEKKILLFFDITCFVLVLGLAYNYSVGVYEYTSTGELRIGTGEAAIPFCYLLIRSFSFFSGEKNNYVFLVASIIGLIFANHRSAYVGVALLLPIAILNRKSIQEKSKYLFHAAVTIIVVIVVLSQFPVIAENFLGRVVSSTDLKDPNLLDRETYYIKAFDFFIENPINGSMNDGQFYSSDIKDQHKIPPHNFIFQLLSTQGIIGFLFIMAIILFVLRIAYKNRSDNISFQMALVIIFYLFFSLLNYTFLNPRNLLVLLFSAALIMHRNRKLLELDTFNLILKSNFIKNKLTLSLDPSEK